MEIWYVTAVFMQIKDLIKSVYHHHHRRRRLLRHIGSRRSHIVYNNERIIHHKSEKYKNKHDS